MQGFGPSKNSCHFFISKFEAAFYHTILANTPCIALLADSWSKAAGDFDNFVNFSVILMIKFGMQLASCDI